MRKYTILHTIETAGPGGAETVLLNLASRLDSTRFRSIVLLPEGRWLPKELRNHGVPTFSMEPSNRYDFGLLRTMARLVRQQQVDLIHSHLPDQNSYSCLVGRLTGRKTIATYHGALRPAEVESLKGALKLHVVRRFAAAVVVVSKYLEAAFQNLDFPGDKLFCIPNGVDVDKFACAEGGHLRRELAYGDRRPLVLMVANLRESKGYEYFVKAARIVADSGVQACFLAVGELHESIMPRLMRLVEQLGLRDRFVFLGFREDVPAILRDVDVFVLSSISEGFSLATVEAMAAGKPVVVTRCGGPEEVIDDGRTGFLVPPADPEALASRICELLADPERAAILGQNARAKVSSAFSMERMVHQYERLYERLLNAR
jgi:glycosyltransferase involved in cell wall biosynthesis